MLLTELTVTRFPRASADVQTNPPDYEFSNALEPTNRDGVEDPNVDEVGTDDELNDQQPDDAPPEENLPDEDEDPDKAGLTRTVPGAHLAYKRAQPDGSFEELWVYSADSIKQSVDTRTAILAGTDIEPHNVFSDDGSQTFEIWSSGNVEFLKITGLPN